MSDLKTVVTNPPYDVMSDEAACAALKVLGTAPVNRVYVDSGLVLAMIPPSEAGTYESAVANDTIKAGWRVLNSNVAGGRVIRGDGLISWCADLLAEGAQFTQTTHDAIVALTVQQWPEWRILELGIEPSVGLIAEARI